jgi:hypothetical protein
MDKNKAAEGAAGNLAAEDPNPGCNRWRVPNDVQRRGKENRCHYLYSLSNIFLTDRHTFYLNRICLIYVKY